MVLTKNHNKAGKKSKRWYFNAQATLPYIGKTGIGFGSGKAKRSLNNIVDRRIVSQAESKRKIATTQTSGPTHNTIYTFNPFSNIGQGTDIFSRIGDEIHVTNFHVRLHFKGKGSVSQQSYRLMLVKHEDEVLSSTDNYLSSGLGSTDLFFTFQNALTSIPDFKRIKVLHDEIIRVPKESTPTQINSVDREYTFPFNKKINFKTGTNFAKTENYYLVIIPHIENGTNGVTIVGDWFHQSRVSFKDT